ncbi:MAG: single-stranded-DNA-specific exonuclease RecJ [Candidatus Nomurabacteria bacterium]|jgi:single-stranded-DNA-specific exonuclease|nr:single-stranded-DNA-specific exonuclease RecJ [Candidatus Nomurabacteria bacterium]
MTQYSQLFRELLSKRGLVADDEIEVFLHPDYNNLHDPFKLPDIDKAVNRLKQTIEKQETITIFGDYDADGVTATSVLYLGLKQMGLTDIVTVLPHRIRDGYGMPKNCVSQLTQTKTTLAITVDCGSKNHDIIEQLNQKGIDVIITDHHEVGDTLPNAIAIVNPKRPDSNYPFADLAGVGVAFKLIQALQKTLHPETLPDGQEKWLLDLVAIGTVCDCMQLVGENRILTHFGFKVISKTRLAGLRELMRTAYRSGKDNIDSYFVGFVIGPRINAAGRLDDPVQALNVFLSEKGAECAANVEALEKLNRKRKTLQDKATEQAVKQINNQYKNIELPDVICVRNTDWHEGLIGIVAGRLVDVFHRPVFAFTQAENGNWKGSGRSFGDYSLADLIKQAKPLMVQGGGHREAAGLVLASDELYTKFIKCANNLYKDKKLEHSDQEKFFRPNPDITIEKINDLSIKFYNELKLLEPFGNGNPEPIFEIKQAKIISKRIIKEKYLKFIIEKSDEQMGMMCFRPEPSWFDLQSGDHADFLFNLELDEYRGTKTIGGVATSISKSH